MAGKVADAKLVIQIIKLNLVSKQRAFVLAHKLNIIPDDLYQLFIRYKPLKRDIPEFIEGFLEEVTNNAE